MVGIRTIRESGHGLTFADAATRHLLTPIDMVGMIGLVMIAVHPRAKRLGDLVAGTVVVRDQPVEAVSYTHLRAHETVLDLVCRLLLEKKKHTRTDDNT